jgi:transcriptional regulator with XRE-family HTH domain
MNDTTTSGKHARPELIEPKIALLAPRSAGRSPDERGPMVFVRAAREALAAAGVSNQPTGCRYKVSEFVGGLGLAIRAARVGLSGEESTQVGFSARVGDLLRGAGPTDIEAEPEQDYISKIETGCSPPSVRRLGAIAAAARVTPSALVVGGEAALRVARERRADFLDSLLARFRQLLRGGELPRPLRAAFAPWVTREHVRPVIAAFPAGVGAAIATFREVASLTQAELVELLRARLAGVRGFERVSTASHSQLESGVYAVSWGRLAGIGQVLGVPLSWFAHLGEKDAVRRQLSVADQMRAVRERTEELLSTFQKRAATGMVEADVVLQQLLKIQQELACLEAASPAAASPQSAAHH